MKTILLLAASDQCKPFFAEAFGPQVNLVLVEPPPDSTRETFDVLLANWLRLADGVVVDAVSLDETTRWALESLRAGRWAETTAVMLRLNAAQRALYHIEPGWLTLSETDSIEQVRVTLRSYLDLRDARARIQRADALLDRHRHAAAAVAAAPSAAGSAPLTAAAELLRYRDALKNFGPVLSKNLDEQALLKEFLEFVGELLGVGKLALFIRHYQNDLFAEGLTLAERQLAIACSHGIAADVAEHLRLDLETGIGGYLAREAKILRRTAFADPLALHHDPQVAREFELLGTEVAVPMFDNDQLLGALTFSGKITAEPLGNEELELVYHLMAQLAQAIRNLHLQAKLVGQQRFMGEILAHMQSGAVAVSQDGRLLSVNRRARALLELGNEELVGRDMRCLPPCVADALFEVLQTGHEIWEYEVTLPRSRRPLSLSATRFAAHLGDNLTLVAVGLLDDLTQTKLQQAQARELADKEFFTRLSSRLSHELKNSLVSIKIYAQLLPERYEEPEFRDQFSHTVTHEINRVDMLVNNLTFFAHPLSLLYEPLRLEELVDTCIRSLADEFARKKLLQVVSFGQSPSGDLPAVVVKKTFASPSQVEGDRVRLTQAFEHVMRNALQAMPKGGRLSISTAAAEPSDFPDGKLPEGGALRLEWQDTGEGIPLEQLKHVTEPFITTRNVGVGLGLTIVKRILERHSGRLLLDSILGTGTKVTMILPLKAQTHPEDQQIEPPTASPRQTAVPSATGS